MNNRTFLIVHGLNGSGEGHWQRWLYEELLKRGEKVFFPQFPSNDKPRLEEWLLLLKREIAKMTGEKVVICHSMGAVLWFHYAMRESSDMVDRVLLAAPPSESIIASMPELREFSGALIDDNVLKNVSKENYLIFTNNDEYCPEGGENYFGKKLSINMEILHNEGGHLNIKSGYGVWPSVLEWCLDKNEKIRANR